MREISLEIFTKVYSVFSLLVFGGQKTHANLILHTKKTIKEMQTQTIVLLNETRAQMPRRVFLTQLISNIIVLK